MENRNLYGFWGFNQPQPQLPKYHIIHVNGEQGARSIQMAPESDIILMDDTAPIVWLVKTDGAGYLQAYPYDIAPHIEQPPVDFNALSARIDKLEELINAKSNAGSSKQSKHQNTTDPSN